MKPLTIVCGMAPGPTGAGYLTSQLLDDKKRYQDRGLIDCRILWGRYGYPFRRLISEGNYLPAFSLLPKWLKSTASIYSGYFEKQIKHSGELLLIHPQTLGFKWTVNLVRRFPRPVWLFLADSSFFCVRSYNYVPEENTPCLRCLGGKFESSGAIGCRPYPENDQYAFNFVAELMRFTADRKIKFVAQNHRQALLAKKHFGDDITVKIVGLWAPDWLPDDKNKKGDIGLKGYDIVFHGRRIRAKGADWAKDLAKYLPSYSFLFPFSKLSTTEDSPPNCFFKDMSWNSGLKSHVIQSRLVLVPSLWSAPIEGALIKSISHAGRTAVVENDTSFSDEVPDHVILKLSTHPEIAACQIDSELTRKSTISKTAKEEFIKTFADKNKNLLERIYSCTNTTE